MKKKPTEQELIEAARVAGQKPQSVDFWKKVEEAMEIRERHEKDIVKKRDVRHS